MKNRTELLALIVITALVFLATSQAEAQSYCSFTFKSCVLPAGGGVRIQTYNSGDNIHAIPVRVDDLDYEESAGYYCDRKECDLRARIGRMSPANDVVLHDFCGDVTLVRTNLPPSYYDFQPGIVACGSK